MRVVSKQSFCSTLSLFGAVTSCKKSEKVNALIFYKTLKTLFWVYFESLFAQKF